jgi:predicted PurR-regulated permease PerM
MQSRIAFALHFVIGTTLMGILVTVALIMGYDTAWPIVIAVAVGFVVAIPISWLVARKITHLVQS